MHRLYHFSRKLPKGLLAYFPAVLKSHPKRNIQHLFSCRSSTPSPIPHSSRCADSRQSAESKLVTLVERIRGAAVARSRPGAAAECFVNEGGSVDAFLKGGGVVFSEDMACFNGRIKAGDVFGDFGWLSGAFREDLGILLGCFVAVKGFEDVIHDALGLMVLSCWIQPSTQTKSLIWSLLKHGYFQTPRKTAGLCWSSMCRVLMVREFSLRS